MPNNFKRINYIILVLLFLVVFLSCTNEQNSSSVNKGKLGYYQLMDYGSVIAESIRLNWPENSLVRKGLAIHLDHNAAMIFDTDLVRFAAGSLGGWIDISKTDYTNYKGSDIAGLEGRQVFGSSEIAGWAKDGNFYGPREDGMGNLPNDWAHYKGYYRYDEKVMLSYSVGGIDVLEIPESIKLDKSVAFVRNIKVASSAKGLQALILQKHSSWSVIEVKDRQIIFNTGEGALAVKLADGSNNVRLVKSEEKESVFISLQIPPSENSQTIRVFIFEMDSPDDGLFDDFSTIIEKNNIPDFVKMRQGGPTQWNEIIKTSGVLSEEHSGYVIDQIEAPFNNPWGSWMRFSGIDFFEDGTRAAVTTWNGDVWIVSGLDETLENVRWRRFASGLFYPMGIAIVDSDIYVTERSQLTRLHDLNGDGEADYYENFNNDGIVYPMAHTLGLEVDSEGYFYFFKNGNRVPSEVPQHGALMRVSPDGKTREVYARGFRGANTIGIGPNDTIYTADQEGNWVPVDRIDVIKQDGFYGDRRHGGENLRIGEFQVPIAWTPKNANNSSGMMVFADDDRWGPFSGHWILGSYGQSKLFAILTEDIGGRLQGGIVELPVKSQSGVMRGCINPTDGQLYMVGLHGWQTLAENDGSFERVRYVGGNVNMPEELHITPQGVEIRFTDPLDSTSARNVNNYNVERWEYIYSERYGSPEMSLEHPGEKGRDSVKVSSVTISGNRKKIFIEIPNMRSVMQMKIAYKLMFASGYESKNVIYHTVNWLSKKDADEKPKWQQRIISGKTESIKEDNAEEESIFKTGSVPKWYKRGASLFKRNCASCHVDGATAPRLSESEWAGGSKETFIRIVLNGKQGDSGIMMPFSWMKNEDLASILSYIRKRWHNRERIRPFEVEKIRQSTQERTEPWTEQELKKF